MKANYRNVLLLIVLMGVLFGFTSPISAQSITQEQAEAMLKELRAIRQLLEQMQGANKRLNVPAAASAGKIKLTVRSGYSLGREDAPLTLVEFTDYQCPFCQQFHAGAFEELKKNYVETGKLRIVSRDLPLGSHQHARKAALAARCAGDQGRFWEMRHMLLTNANKLSSGAISQYAQDLKLDMDAYQSCVDTKKYDEAINKGIAEAEALGITGTPTFILGHTRKKNFEGTKIVGSQQFAAFEARIKELLSATE